MIHEFRYALRRLWSRPWHTTMVVAIVALGTGAAFTVFRVADAVLLRALPYREADRLVRVNMHIPLAPTSELPFSDVGYRTLELRSTTLETVASYRAVGVNLSRGPSPERVTSVRVTANFFDVLGLRPQLGRLFLPHEETMRNPPIIVLSDGLWRRSFAADPRVVGSTVRINGMPATIVGVADPRIAFPVSDAGYYTLMDLDPVGTNPLQLGLDVVARLRPGVTLAAAASDASRVLQEYARANPGPHRLPNSDVSGFHAIVRPLRDDMAGGITPTLGLLTTAVLLVLCLTCVNVATLELVRSSSRRGELALRSALGASRGRMIAGALFEGSVQAIAGVGVGVMLSASSVTLLQSLMPKAFGADLTAHVSAGILAAALATIAVAAMAAGLFPIAMTLRGDLQSGLRDREGAHRHLGWVRSGLIVTQLAFACVLVDAAALMIITIRESQRVTLGFQPDGVVVFQLNLPDETYPTPQSVVSGFNGLVERLRGLAGNTRVALASNVPLDGNDQDNMLGIEGRPFHADGTDPNVDLRIVSSGYFDVLGIHVISGRGFREGDAYLDGTPAVISKTAATMIWPDGTSPIGQRIRTGPFAPWMTIVGVVSDARNRSLTRPSYPEVYLPFGAPRSPVRTQREMSVIIRTSGSTTALAASAQRIVRGGGPDLPVYNLRSLTDVVVRSQLRESTIMRTLSAFALVALALAMAGSHAMLSFLVAQRRRELAVRQAIGATSIDLVTMIGREMGLMLIVGVAVGVVGAAAADRALSRFLFAVAPWDPRVIVVTVTLVSTAGFVSALAPARRAGASDPMLVLRAE